MRVVKADSSSLPWWIVFLPAGYKNRSKSERGKKCFYFNDWGGL